MPAGRKVISVALFLLIASSANAAERKYEGETEEGRPGWYPPTTHVYYLPTSTVTIDIVDGESRKRIWRSFAIDYLRGKPARIDKLVDRETRKMFKRFPVESSK